MILRRRWRIKRAISCARNSSLMPGFVFDLIGGFAHRRWEDQERCSHIRRLRSDWIEASSAFEKFKLRLRIWAVGFGISGAVGFLAWVFEETGSYIRNKLLSWDP